MVELGGEEPLELVEPAFEPLPMLADREERRLHVRARRDWASRLAGRAFPLVADLDSAMRDAFAPYSLLLDWSGQAAPRLRFIGERLAEACGLGGAAGRAVDGVPHRPLLSHILECRAEILETRAPVDFEVEFASPRGVPTLYRGSLMPLSSDGAKIDAVYGVIGWKELADADMAIELVLAVAQALGGAPPVISPAVAVDEALFGAPRARRRAASCPPGLDAA